jgi:hypothetical protein
MSKSIARKPVAGILLSLLALTLLAGGCAASDPTGPGDGPGNVRAVPPPPDKGGLLPLCPSALAQAQVRPAYQECRPLQ